MVPEIWPQSARHRRRLDILLFSCDSVYLLCLLRFSAQQDQQRQRCHRHRQIQREIAVIAGGDPVPNRQGDLQADDSCSGSVRNDASEPAAVPLLLDIIAGHHGIGKAGQIDPLPALLIPNLPLVRVGLSAASDLHREGYPRPTEQRHPSAAG